MTNTKVQYMPIPGFRNRMKTIRTSFLGNQRYLVSQHYGAPQVTFFPEAKVL